MKKAVLGAGVLVSPLAWFISLEANFALAPLACAGHGKGPLLLVSVVCFALALASLVFAWSRRSLDRRLGIAGVSVSAFCALVIAAQAIPNILLGGCE